MLKIRLGQHTAILLLLAGCLAAPELPLLSDVELDERALESGLVAPDVAAPETAIQELEAVGDLPKIDTTAAPNSEAILQNPRRGLAALFGRRTKEKTTDVGGMGNADVAPNAQVIASGVDGVSDIIETEGEDSAKPARTVRPARKGPFGPRRAKTSRFAQVRPGVVLPFGQIGLACGLRANQLGKEVDRFPERGKGYRLFDTNPATTLPRTHFITGFKDGCPRQFTASLALLDSPVLHERLLSVKSSQGQHTTEADMVFQDIRSQVCHVGRGKACPAKRVDKMEKTIAFVTTYDRFGGNATWTEILIHNGVIAASSSQVR